MSVYKETRSDQDSSAESIRKEPDHVTADVTPVYHNEDYVFLGGKKHLKSDLLYAFGGDFNPGAHLAPRLKLGNASPMGLFAFGTTTFILSLINAGARGVSGDSIVVGSALFYGGMIQTIAGIWELIVENTWGATVFSAYGGYWMSFGVIHMDGFNVASAYTDESEFNNAMGLFLTVWALVTALFTTTLLRSTVAMFSLLLSVTLTYCMLAGQRYSLANGNYNTADHLQIAGGVFGCLASMLAYYNGLAGLMNKENCWISIRPIYMPGAIRPDPNNKPEKA